MLAQTAGVLVLKSEDARLGVKEEDGQSDWSLEVTLPALL